jgi:hypothetical protein
LRGWQSTAFASGDRGAWVKRLACEKFAMAITELLDHE